MTSTTFSALLTETASVLDGLAQAYDAVHRERSDVDPSTAGFAEYLKTRELRTIQALENYSEHDADAAALDVHVRLASAFPFVADDLVIPDHATLDELVKIAERSDELLGLLGERIQVYAVSGRLREALDSLGAHVAVRRRELATVLNELENYDPSPRQHHS